MDFNCTQNQVSIAYKAKIHFTELEKCMFTSLWFLLGTLLGLLPVSFYDSLKKKKKSVKKVNQPKLKHFGEQGVGKYIVQPLWAPMFVWLRIRQKMNSVGWQYPFCCLFVLKFQTSKKIIGTEFLQGLQILTLFLDYNG